MSRPESRNLKGSSGTPPLQNFPATAIAEAASAFASIEGLSGVYISKCALFGLRVDDEVSRRLRHFDKTRATEFDFSNIRAGPSFRCVLDALIAAPDIECLAWRRGGLQDFHVEAIVNAARRFFGLHQIDLGENEGITDIGGTLLLKFLTGNNINNSNGDRQQQLQRTPQLIRLDQTSVSVQMQAKINSALTSPLKLQTRSSFHRQPSPAAQQQRQTANNMSATMKEYLKPRGSSSNLQQKQQQQKLQSVSSTPEHLLRQQQQQLLLAAPPPQAATPTASSIQLIAGASGNTSATSSITNSRPSAAVAAVTSYQALAFLNAFHSFVCALLATALWVPHNRFKTLICCFCYFVGVGLTFGPSSGVIDTVAISLILMGVQRWRNYYAASGSSYSSTSSASSSPAVSSFGNQTLPVVVAAAQANGGGEGMTFSSNAFIISFSNLSQGARRRWSDFLDPLEQLTNVLEAATSKKQEILDSAATSSAPSRKNKTNISNQDENDATFTADDDDGGDRQRRQLYEDDLRDEQDQNNIILFEQMVRNCTFQYTRFLLSIFWFDPHSHFMFAGTLVSSLITALVVRLATGYSAYAVGSVFVIWGSLFFGLEPLLASGVLAVPSAAAPLTGATAASSSTASGLSSVLSLTAIVRYYRIRFGRWIAGHPVTSADDYDYERAASPASSSESVHRVTTSYVGRRPPFSFIVEVLRIEDSIIRTKQQRQQHQQQQQPSITPLAKIRCMNKSWTSGEAEAHCTYSKSTQSCITTSATWHPECSSVFHSPHPFDTAKMTFSIYDTASATTSANYSAGSGDFHSPSSASAMVNSSEGILEVLLQGTFLIDDDLVFGTEVAIPLKSMVGSSAGSEGTALSGGNAFWSLSETLLRQIDDKDAEERVRHRVAAHHHQQQNAHQQDYFHHHQHHQHHNNVQSNYYPDNINSNNIRHSSIVAYNSSSAAAAAATHAKEYSIERPGVLIVRFSEVGSNQLATVASSSSSPSSSSPPLALPAAASPAVASRAIAAASKSVPRPPVPRAATKKIVSGVLPQQQHQVDVSAKTVAPRTLGEQTIAGTTGRSRRPAIASVAQEVIDRDDEEMTDDPKNNGASSRHPSLPQPPPPPPSSRPILSSHQRHHDERDDGDAMSTTSSTEENMRSAKSPSAATHSLNEALLERHNSTRSFRGEQEPNNLSSNTKKQQRLATFKEQVAMATAAQQQQQSTFYRKNTNGMSLVSNPKQKQSLSSNGNAVSFRSDQSECSVQFLPDEGH